MNAQEIETFRKSVSKLEQCSHRMMNAACLEAEIEAMKAENQQAEAKGNPPVHGFKQFMNAMQRWHYNG